jgi:hypothetical protein
MKSQTSATFTAKQDLGATLLASGKSIRDVASELGAGERTIHD